MSAIIEYLFGAASFMPHGYCLLWRPDLVAIHATSDFLIAASYFSIPVALATFVTKRKDIQYSWVFWHFVTFIAACGATHLVSLVTLYWPVYGAQGLLKAGTALVSVTTAVMLWPLIPKALALPSPEQLRLSNESLRQALQGKEQALSELQSFLDAAPLAMLLIDREGIITRISSSAAGIFGYEPYELVGEPLGLLIPDWDRHIASDSPAASTVEASGCTKVGRRFPVELARGEYKLSDGPRHCLTVRDVSREWKAEAARRHSEALKSGVLEAALDAVVTIDHRGIVMDWNRASEQIFGYTRAEAVGREMAELIVPARMRDAHRRGLAHAASGGQSTIMGRLIELPAQNADGREFPVDLYIVAIPTEGSPMFTGFARDISERKRREQELRDEKARLASLLDSAATAILTIDGKGLIESANAATEQLFGYTELELIGRNVRTLTPESHHPQHDTYLTDYLATGSKKTVSFGREVAGVRKDSTTFPTHMAVSEFEAHGKRHFTVVIYDLSDRKQAEEALRETETRLAQVQKMEAVGQLSGGVAHDFNNLLTVIGGNLELHAARLPVAIDQRLLNDAREAVEMGARLTERLLTFSRQQRLAPIAINLNEQVLSMAELLRRTLGENIDFSAVLASDLWATCADPSGLENVILNLAINARDAMPRGGKLIIETRNLTLENGHGDKLTPGSYVLLSVSDSGTGMEPDVAARAFEPFFTTKEPGKGTGLGLASVYGFVNQTGGHAEIYSEVGKGTTINVYLPRDQGATEPEERAKQTQAREVPKGQTILVVEDNPLVRRLTVRRLHGLGFKVLEAESGPAALNLLTPDEHVDLVFSDVVMAGGMSGLELARQIQATRPGLRILLTTGFAEEIARGGAGGWDDPPILRKPYSQDQLIHALELAMKHEQSG